MPIKGMSGNITVILNNKLTNEDVTAIIMIEGSFKADYQIPTLLVPGLGTPLNIQAGFRKIGEIENNTVTVGNITYRSGEKGVIQFTVRKGDDPKEFENAVNMINELIAKAGLKERVFAYELYLNLVEEGNQLREKRIKLPKLETMSDPKLFGLRIFDAILSEDDIRSQPWKQINIEPLIQDPTKISITMTYRMIYFENSIISKAFLDAEKLMNYLKEVA
ncbi:MAG: hypothetical protein LVQ96_05605 [Thermoplasmatales archaeon]|nr:hypothetical protein [Thermoplasmatales archaeon]MCW6170628.1 hypothetical protein [Thermoplasmatales archaeon]